MIRLHSHRLLLCGVPVDPATPASLSRTIVEWSAQRWCNKSRPKHISYLNAHVHNLARRDPRLRQALIDTALCYADGASIVWACRRHGEEMPPRLTAADFLPDILAKLTETHRRVFLLGGAPSVAERATATLQRQVPKFSPVGIRDGYFQPGESEKVVEAINAASPDLLIVGMGTPRQELWVRSQIDKLNVPVIWTVGALFDYFAGSENRCPKWMGDRGLEWMYRLMMQPRRMAGRYLVGNPQFVVAALRGKLEKK